MALIGFIPLKFSTKVLVNSFSDLYDINESDGRYHYEIKQEVFIANYEKFAQEFCAYFEKNLPGFNPCPNESHPSTFEEFLKTSNYKEANVEDFLKTSNYNEANMYVLDASKYDISTNRRLIHGHSERPESIWVFYHPSGKISFEMFGDNGVHAFLSIMELHFNEKISNPLGKAVRFGTWDG